MLLKGALTDAVLEALRRRNPGARFVDRGAYVRVEVDVACRLLRRDVEEASGAAFALPADLEPLMPSFHGRLRLSADEAEWGQP